MTSLKTLIKIELLEHRKPAYCLSILAVTTAMSLMIRLGAGKDSHSVTLILNSMLLLVVVGTLMSLSIIEGVKNEESKGLLKTYSSYPITASEYVLSKLIAYLFADFLVIVPSAVFSILILGAFSTNAFFLIFFSLLFAIFSATSVFLIAIFVLRLGMIPEIFIVFYYFGLLFFAFGSFDLSALVPILPYLMLFTTFLGLQGINISTINTNIFLIVYSLIIVTSIPVFKIGGWKIIHRFT